MSSFDTVSSHTPKRASSNLCVDLTSYGRLLGNDRHMLTTLTGTGLPARQLCLLGDSRDGATLVCRVDAAMQHLDYRS